MTNPPSSGNQPVEPPNVVQKVDQNQLRHFVKSIKSAEQQVGENIIQALSHDDTVAVLTTVVMSPAGQRVVSAALDPAMMQQVQQILVTAQTKRIEEEKCMGFHCFIKPIDDPSKVENKPDE